MFTSFKKQGYTVLLDPKKDVDIEGIEGKVDLILSPSLYWIKKVHLPIKRLYELKKILPSLFEESLPQGNYSYTAYGKEGEYVAFAYEDAKILELLHQKGIALSKVGGIYFAQYELQEYLPLRIDATTVLVERDGIVLSVPSILVAHDVLSRDISVHKPSSKSITIEHYSNIIDNKTIYKIAGVLALFVLVVLGEYFVTLSKVNTLEDAQRKVFATYHLLPTMMQNRSVLEKYERQFAKQSKLREYLSKLLQLKLHPSEHFSLVEYGKSGLHIVVEGVTNKHHIVQQLQTIGDALQIQQRKNRLDIKVTL